jgi:phytoene desaturase
MERKAAVIGAGIGGLATAIRLRAMGYLVDVFEKEPLPGGKLMELRRDGFRFDLGPSLFTQPERVEELFTLMGEQAADHFRYRRLKNICRYYWPDGTRLDVPADPDEFAYEVRRILHIDPGTTTEYLEKARNLYETAAPLFLDRPFPTWEGMTSEAGQKIGRSPWILDPFISLHKRNQKTFGDPRLVQLFDRYATYNGSDPYKAPATLKMIAHLENNLGAFFPERGMYSIAREITNLGLRNGIRYHLGSAVTRINRYGEDGRVSGIRVNGRDLRFDEVVSDVDIHTLYRRGMVDFSPPLIGRKQQRSTSALIFYWGVSGSYPELDLHNILFSSDYREEFRSLFQKKTLPDDPTIYIFNSSRVCPEDALPGHENWFVMINTPENCGQDWNSLIREARSRILDRIQKLTRNNIAQRIVFEHIEDPRTIESRTGSWAGSLYGNSSNSRMSAFSRHPNMRKVAPGLWFTGGSVHPGGGIPLCLASAKIVAQQIETKNTYENRRRGE